jgi:transposase
MIANNGAKTDALDARRAASQALGRPWLSSPRARGDREALRVLETVRRGAQTARVAAINELKALVVTAPVDLRDQLQGLTTAALVTKANKFRPGQLTPGTRSEHTATKMAMRSLARRIRTLTTEIAELKTPIGELVTAVAPQLLDQPGIGPITAAQVLIAWSHPRRCRNEAAFARLAGVAPLEASSGQHTRHRLNRRGDRQLNRAIHNIAITRTRHCPKTRAYIAKRTSQGKTTREARRCLKRYIARNLYRLLENPPPTT